MVRPVELGLVAAWFGRRGSVGCVCAWLVTVRHGRQGVVRQGVVGLVRVGPVRRGLFWQAR